MATGLIINSNQQTAENVFAAQSAISAPASASTIKMNEVAASRFQMILRPLAARFTQIRRDLFPTNSAAAWALGLSLVAVVGIALYMLHRRWTEQNPQNGAPNLVPQHPPAVAAPLPPQAPLSQAEMKQNIVKWVQKHLCKHLHLRFNLGMAENPLMANREGPSQQIRVRIGDQEGQFDQAFLESIPFFECLLRVHLSLNLIETQTHGLITLSEQCPFTLKMLQDLQAIEKDPLCTSYDSLDPVALDFLGDYVTRNVLRKFNDNFRDFQKWMIEAGDSEAIQKLGDMDLTPFSRQAPQVKVASHQFDLKDWNLPDLAPTIKFLDELSGQMETLRQSMRNIDAATRERRTSELGTLRGQLSTETDKVQNAILSFLNQYKSHLKICSHLTANTLLNNWMVELVQIDYRLRGGGNAKFHQTPPKSRMAFPCYNS